MNAEEFHERTGSMPENDDLDRVNCEQAGEIGHSQCGVCEHGHPKFLVCFECHPEWKAEAVTA